MLKNYYKNIVARLDWLALAVWTPLSSSFDTNYSFIMKQLLSLSFTMRIFSLRILLSLTGFIYTLLLVLFAVVTVIFLFTMYVSLLIEHDCEFRNNANESR